jgi:mono/diheme cytochrome c family protein
VSVLFYSAVKELYSFAVNTTAMKYTAGYISRTVLVAGWMLFTTGRLQAAPPEPGTGEYLYIQNCSRCHGADGTKGFLGARNLQKSRLEDPAIVQKIQRGKGLMPSFRKKLTPEEMSLLLLYVKQLRKN